MEFLVAAIAVLLLLAWITLEGRLRPLEADVKRLERKLDAIAAHLGVEMPEPAGMDEVDALLHDGKQVAAVKRYRELTGADLREAKQAVDLRAAANPPVTSA